MPAFRKPVASSPPPSDVVAMITVRTERPPPASDPTISMIARPMTGTSTAATRGGRGDRRPGPRRGARVCVDRSTVGGRTVARQAPEDHRDHREARRVEQEGYDQPADRDEDPGDRRADHEGQVVQRGPGAVRRSQLVFVLDEVREVRPDRRAEEGGEAGPPDGQRDDEPDRAVEEDDRGDHEHQDPAGHVRREEDQAPVEAVRNDPGGDRQDEVGEDARGADEPEDERVLGDLVDQDQDRDEVQPVPDRGDELADQEPGERPVAEELAVGAEDGHPRVLIAAPATGAGARRPPARGGAP